MEVKAPHREQRRTPLKTGALCGTTATGACGTAYRLASSFSSTCDLLGISRRKLLWDGSPGRNENPFPLSVTWQRKLRPGSMTTQKLSLELVRVLSGKQTARDAPVHSSSTMKQGARSPKDSSMKKLLLVLLLTTVLRGQNSGTTVSITDTDEVHAGQILTEEFAQKKGMSGPLPRPRKSTNTCRPWATGLLLTRNANFPIVFTSIRALPSRAR